MIISGWKRIQQMGSPVIICGPVSWTCWIWQRFCPRPKPSVSLPPYPSVSGSIWRTCWVLRTLPWMSCPVEGASSRRFSSWRTYPTWWSWTWQSRQHFWRILLRNAWSWTSPSCFSLPPRLSLRLSQASWMKKAWVTWPSTETAVRWW